MNHQSGNVLFLILIAVALFAALSYAVTTSTRSGGKDANQESAKTDASVILQYLASLRTSIQRVKISNNCTDETLDFVNPIYKRNDGSAVNSANSSAPANKSCHIFDLAGGGQIPVVLPVTAFDLTHSGMNQSSTLKPGHGEFQIMQIQNVGTTATPGTASANDVTVAFWYLNKKTCIEINNLLDVNNPGGDPPTLTFSGSVDTYNNDFSTSSFIFTNPTQFAFCGWVAALSGYNMFYALIER